jgi:hypothetical protein
MMEFIVFMPANEYCWEITVESLRAVEKNIMENYR